MRTLSIPRPTPEQIVSHLFRKMRRDEVHPDLLDKSKAMRAVTRASVSLPVVTIATRDHVEAEMQARASADRNLTEYYGSVGASLSPETLDS